MNNNAQNIIKSYEWPEMLRVGKCFTKSNRFVEENIIRDKDIMIMLLVKTS